MQPKDKISKAVWNICESCKEVVASNLVQASRTGVLNLDETQQQAVIQLVSQSVDQAFHKAFSTFLKSVDAAINDVQKMARGTSVPPT